MSAQKTPTLCDAIPAYEILLCAFREAKTVLPRLSEAIDECIRKIEEYMNIERRKPIYALSISTPPLFSLWLHHVIMSMNTLPFKVLHPDYKLDWLYDTWNAAD